jgi:hypothetical protein
MRARIEAVLRCGPTLAPFPSAVVIFPCIEVADARQ